MLKRNERTVKIPVVGRNAEIRSFDEESNTAEMIFTTAAKVRRFDFFDGPFMEELSMDEEHVRMERVDKGAVPFLRDHGRGWGPNIDDVLGKVEEATFDGERGIAKVRFSKRPEFAGVIQDIKDGILRNVSVGYRVHKFEKEEATDENELPVFRAIDWEILEISSVAIGADASAGFRSERSESERSFECKISEEIEEDLKEEVENERDLSQDEKTGETQMKDKPIKDEVDKTQEMEAARNEARKEGVETEKRRQAEIRSICKKAKFDDLAETYIEAGHEVSKVRELIIDALETRDAETETRSAIPRTEVVRDEEETMRRGIEEAVLFRANQKGKLEDIGREWAGLSLLETVREYARRNGNRNVNSLSRHELAKLAFTRAAVGMHTSSDFPSILENIISKSLRGAYQASPATFEPLVVRRQLPDFKDVSRPQTGLGDKLEKVGASGEIKHTSMSDSAEKYALDTYAKLISIDRKTIINDDLEALSRMPAAFGVKARSLESDLVWGIITTNAALQATGFNLFSGSGQHGNLASAGAAPSIATLGNARAAMRLQKDPDGEPLNIQLAWLVVPAALETVGEQLVSADLNPDDVSKVNPFRSGGRTPTQLIVEPRLDANSSAAWYGAASKDQIEMIELGTLQGSDEPLVEQEDMFQNLGMSMRVIHDVAAKALDFRGLYKNPG